MMRIVVCAPDHAGTLNQALGVGGELRRLMADRGRTTALRRYRWTDPILARLPLVHAGSWLVISCGAAGERKARRLKRAAPHVFWCHIEVPKAVGVVPDLLVVPAHDRDRADAADSARGVTRRLETAGVPHRIRRADLVAARDDARRRLHLVAGDRAAVFLVGGPSAAFDLSNRAVDGICDHIARITAAGDRAFVVPSRRTPAALRSRLTEMAGSGVLVWNGKGDLLYATFLAAADYIFVTEDSISMSCEAAATGAAVYRLPLLPIEGERLAKIRRFQHRWNAHLLPASEFGRAMPVRADVPEDAALVAAEILRLTCQKAANL